MCRAVGRMVEMEGTAEMLCLSATQVVVISVLFAGASTSEPDGGMVAKARIDTVLAGKSW